MIFVTSWDDGHPLDERVADLLCRFGLKATFFVPIFNREGRSVLSTEALRSIDEQFEIGSHTLTHVYLTSLSSTECIRQVTDGKNAIEQVLGHEVKGFCSPGGKWNTSVRQTVIEAGFTYARTIENLRFDCDGDRFSIPTTIQFFPHPSRVMFRNFIRYGHYVARFKAFKAVLSGEDWIHSLRRLLDMAEEENSILHIWGHSWEVEEYGLWAQLENFLELVSTRNPVPYTINEVLHEKMNCG